MIKRKSLVGRKTKVETWTDKTSTVLWGKTINGPKVPSITCRSFWVIQPEWWTFCFEFMSDQYEENEMFHLLHLSEKQIQFCVFSDECPLGDTLNQDVFLGKNCTEIVQNRPSLCLNDAIAKIWCCDSCRSADVNRTGDHHFEFFETFPSFCHVTHE